MAPSNKIKQESLTFEPVNSGKRSKKTTISDKKRNLVRWNDDVDKQVLLTLQWACNEVGIKPPWELVAQTMGNGVTSGAIIQHLAKLRGKMIKAEISVPPKLSRGIIAKEPSKIYANSNGKRLPPPVFPAPSTPTQATPKNKPKSKAKSKRGRSGLEDSDEEIIDFIQDSDEDYGVTKKKARISRAKPKANTTKGSQKPSKTRQAAFDAANKEINGDILSTLEGEEGEPANRIRQVAFDAANEKINDDNLSTLEGEIEGPASRTRHAKQNFSNMDDDYTDAEEEEGGEDEEDSDKYDDELADKFSKPLMHSPTSIKEEHSVSPRAMGPRNDRKVCSYQVAQWSSDVTSSMHIPETGLPVTAEDDAGAREYTQPISTVCMGLHTPQPSRNASIIALTPSFLSTMAPRNAVRTPRESLAYSGFLSNTNSVQEIATPVNFHSFGSHMNTLNQGVDNLGFNIGNNQFDSSTPFQSADLNTDPEEQYGTDSAFLDSFDWGGY